MADLAAPSGASLVGYMPTWGAESRTVEARQEDQVSVLDFFLVGEADSTGMLQRALDYWKNNACDLLLPSGNTFTISAPLVVDFSVTPTTGQKKRIIGYGAIINAASVTGDALTIKVTGASTLVRDLFISGLRITSSSTGAALVMQGPLDGTSYFYNNCIRDCTLVGKTGLKLLGNFFESSIENNHITAGTTGYGIYIDTAGGSGAGSGGVISSLTLYQNTTRFGVNGVYVSATSADVNILGGSYLQAQQYGIQYENATGGYIKGAHLEANWKSNIGLVTTQAGIYAVISGTFAIENCTSVCSVVDGQTHAVRVFVAAGACAVLTSGVQYNGSEQFYVHGAAGSAAIINGTGTFTNPNAVIAVTQNTGLRSVVPIRGNSQLRFISPTTVTPNGQYSSYFLVLTANATIAAPTFTPELGDELEFIIEQAGSGGYTLTWNAAFKPGAFVPTGAYAKISTIRFKYINSVGFATSLWVVVSTATS